MENAQPKPVASYLQVLDDLLEARQRGPLDDETEARFATALNDWRLAMTPSEEAELDSLLEERLKR